MKNALVCVLVTITLLCCTTTRVHADISLAYSFEGGLQGFFGLGATVTQDTIGATHGTNSMKYDIGNGGFVGARTETVIPADLNDPPGVLSVLFDVTIVTPYAGTFADIGVTVFGHQLNAPVPTFGNQVQFADTVSVATLAAGTYLDRQIDLDMSVGPFGAGQSFNQIFGPGQFDLTVASAFQFFVSKNVANPLTLYIDNVRLVTVPEPATLGICASITMLGALRRRR